MDSKEPKLKKFKFGDLVITEDPVLARIRKIFE